jgi:hypothetical protein
LARVVVLSVESRVDRGEIVSHMARLRTRTWYVCVLMILPVLLAAAFAHPAFAGGRFEVLGRLTGGVNVAVEQGDLVYVAIGGDLLVGERAGAGTPRWIGRLNLPVTVVTDLAVYRGVGYVAAGDDGVRVLDLAVPERPAEIGSVRTLGFAASVALAGRWLFVADTVGGLVAIDVGRPAAPALVATAGTSGRAHHLAVAGAVAFVVSDTGYLTVFDVARPAAPETIARVWLNAVSVAVAGDYAYVGTGEGLAVLDVRDPAAPKVLYEPSSDRSYVEGPVLDVVHVDDIVVAVNIGVNYYWEDKRYLATYDVGNPTRPERKSFTELPAASRVTYLGRVRLAGRRVQVAANAERFWTAALGPSGTVDSLSPVPLMPYGSANMAASAGLAFASESGGTTYLTTVADPANTMVASRWPWSRYVGGFKGPANGRVFAMAGRAYVAGPGGLEIVDASDPVAPRLLGTYVTGYGITDVQVVGRLAFAVHGQQGSGADLTAPELLVLDVADPARPIATGRLALTYTPRRIAVDGALAFVTMDSTVGSDKVAVLDVASPTTPRLAGMLDIDQGTALGVVAAGPYAYVAASRDLVPGLTVVSARYPAAPCVAGRLTIDGTPPFAGGGNVARAGDRVYLAARDAGLWAIDVAEPHAPREVEAWQPRGGVLDVAVDGDRLMVATGMTKLRADLDVAVGGGVQVLRWTEPAPTAASSGPAGPVVRRGPIAPPAMVLPRAGLPVRVHLPWLSCACPERCE